MKNTHSEFDIDEFLKLLGKFGDIVFVPTPGNAGDSLINCAAFQKLRENSIVFSTTTTDCPIDVISGKIVVYAGAGGLVPHFRTASDFVDRIIKHSARLVILPATIRGCDDLVKRFRKNDVIICRDPESLNHVKSLRTPAQVFISDDLAISFDAKRFLETPPSTIAYLQSTLATSKYHFKIAVLETAKWLALMLKYKTKTLFNKKEINIFRADREATIPQPRNNIDISSFLEGNDMSELGSAITTYRMLKFVGLFDVIHSNRLHAIIAGLLVEKEVFAYNNSYGKNYAIYNFSLKGKFNNLTWGDANEHF